MQVVRPSELEGAGCRFARMLDDLDVGVRGAVAVLAGNTPEFLATYRGATWSGRRLTPMSWRWTPADVRYVVGNCEADVLVVDARHAPLAEEAAELVAPERRFAIGGPIDGFRPWSDIESQPGDPLPHPVCGTTMLYTSGTTGRPKGVRREPPDHPPPGSMGRGGMSMLEWCLQGEADGTHLVCTPLYHAGPLTYADGASLLGAALVLVERFDAEGVLRAIEEHGITSTFMVPTQFVRLLRLPESTRRRYDVSSLRLLVHGSAPVAPDVKRAMIDWLGPVLFEFYGGTEGGGVSIDSKDWLAHPGSVGQPRPGLVVDILDDRGVPVPTGTEGQIWFRGAERFEYKDDGEKTAEAWMGDRFTLGDIGYVDADGYLYLCDRRADVVITGGVNIYPAQVEAVLLAHPAVADCCVVGVPDDEWGERVHAVVIADGTDAGELLEHCRAHLGPHQVPRDVELVDELPRTETGKLARRTVRDRFWAGRERRI